jgi:hypothetical protein
MLQNQPNQPITTPLFQTSLRSWRANYLARQQAQTAEQPQAEKVEETPAEPQAQAAPTRVKRLAPRRRKKRQAAGAGA